MKHRIKNFAEFICHYEYLSNFSRKYYIEDLQKACCDYLTKELSTETTVSRRQVYTYLKEMELSPSMQAPIVAYQDGQRKYYRYSKEGFSIVDLTDDELMGLEATVNMLRSVECLSLIG